MFLFLFRENHDMEFIGLAAILTEGGAKWEASVR